MHVKRWRKTTVRGGVEKEERRFGLAAGYEVLGHPHNVKEQ